MEDESRVYSKEGLIKELASWAMAMLVSHPSMNPIDRNNFEGIVALSMFDGEDYITQHELKEALIKVRYDIVSKRWQ